MLLLILIIRTALIVLERRRLDPLLRHGRGMELYIFNLSNKILNYHVHDNCIIHSNHNLSNIDKFKQ